MCSFVGRLGAKPELKYAAGGSGTAFATVGLAVNESRKVDGEWKTETTWVNLVFFGQKAENAVNVLEKGDSIVVESKYQKREYENEAGEKRYSHSFIVQSWSRISRAGGSADGGSDYGDEEDGEIPF